MANQIKSIDKKGILSISDSIEIPATFYDTILNHIKDNTILGLGEGTHGTSEFNSFRSNLTKKLIQEKNFEFVCFENNYGGTYMLDQALKAESKDIQSLILENFIAIYHTPEISDFFQWLSGYQKNHSNKVNIVGMDYAEITPALKAMEISMADPNKYRKELDQLLQFCLYQDRSTRRGFDRNLWLKNGMIGYEIINKIRLDKKLKKKDEFQFALSSMNLKLGFEIVHKYQTTGKDLSRDSAMAEMVKIIKEYNPTSKISIWAHNAHVAKKSIFRDLNGGGEGEFLGKMYPNQYFSIGTITSFGTYGVTKDKFPTKINYFFNDRLSKAPNNALETKLAELGHQAIIIDPLIALGTGDKYPVRFSGFQRLPKGESDFVSIEPASCFDLLLYLKKTTAPSHF